MIRFLFLFLYIIHFNSHCSKFLLSKRMLGLSGNRRIYFRSYLARAIIEKLENEEEIRNSDKSVWYRCDLSRLPEDISQRYLQLYIDDETNQFLEQSYERSDWLFTQLLHTFAKSFLSWFMTSTSINGLLGRGSMFVCSTQQFQQLLNISFSWKGDFMLDLGAGDGKVTQKLAKHFSNIHVTELSIPMQWRLKKFGYRVLDANNWIDTSTKYDLILCLNVIDRCDKPLSLLHDIKSALKSQTGLLLLAVVLPFNAYVEFNSSGHTPTEFFHIEGSSFEEQVASLWTNLFQLAGFEILKWTRVPYLCEGDLHQSLYWLDDALFVLKAIS